MSWSDFSSGFTFAHSTCFIFGHASTDCDFSTDLFPNFCIRTLSSSAISRDERQALHSGNYTALFSASEQTSCALVVPLCSFTQRFLFLIVCLFVCSSFACSGVLTALYSCHSVALLSAFLFVCRYWQRCYLPVFCFCFCCYLQRCYLPVFCFCFCCYLQRCYLAAVSNCCRLGACAVYTIQPCTCFHWKARTQGVFRHLPPALLAEWPGSFTCCCDVTGAERAPK